MSDCLKDLSIAIHQQAMYPPDHPTLGPTAARLTDRITELLKTNRTLSFGAAKDQLVIGGVASDSNNPLLGHLAGLLHRHHLGAVSFHRGVTQDEVGQFLALVSEDPDRSGDPLGLGPPERRERLPNIRLHAVAYDSLRLLEDESNVVDDEASRAARTRYAQLWLGLARAAVASGQEVVPSEPEAVAQAISEQGESDAYDQVIVGYMLQIAEELKHSSGPEAVQLSQRMAHMIWAVERSALLRLLRMGDDAGQRREFLMNTSKGLKAEAILILVEAAWQSESEEVSFHLLRMLHKLTQEADRSSGERRERAREAVEEQVSALVTEWALQDPNPEGYSISLREMAAVADTYASADERVRPEPKRLVDMGFEMDLTGESVIAAAAGLLEGEDVGWLFDRMAGNKSSPLTRWLVGGVDEFKLILQGIIGDEEEEVDLALLRKLLELSTSTAVVPLIEAVIEGESQQVRRAILDRLLALEPVVGVVAVQYLDDPRWYVTRNMLWILNGLLEVPGDFVPDPYLSHEDHRVRYEAVRLATRVEESRDKAIIRGLSDDDEKTIRLALNAASKNCPDAALPLVVSRVSSGPEDLRVLAVRVLGGAVGNETAVSTLLKMTQPEKRVLGLKHPPKSAVYLAALRALHSHPNDRRAHKVLDLAGQQRDPEIEAAVRNEGKVDE